MFCFFFWKFSLFFGKFMNFDYFLIINGLVGCLVVREIHGVTNNKWMTIKQTMNNFPIDRMTDDHQQSVFTLSPNGLAGSPVQSNGWLAGWLVGWHRQTAALYPQIYSLTTIKTGFKCSKHTQGQQQEEKSSKPFLGRTVWESGL